MSDCLGYGPESDFFEEISLILVPRYHNSRPFKSPGVGLIFVELFRDGVTLGTILV